MTFLKATKVLKIVIKTAVRYLNSLNHSINSKQHLVTSDPNGLKSMNATDRTYILIVK